MPINSLYSLLFLEAHDEHDLCGTILVMSLGILAFTSRSPSKLLYAYMLILSALSSIL